MKNNLRGKLKVLPFLMKPCYKQMPWGGEKLNLLYGKNSEFKLAGESWEAADHKNGKTFAANGIFKGFSLNKLGRILKAEPFPVLFKLIDAREKLSLQVHPTDELAVNDNGKNEMWIILSCMEDSVLYLGFEKKISKEEYKARILNNTLEEVLKKVTVKKGEAYYLPAGLVHAIGGGIVIAEIQQNSDATYRISDWGRLGIDSKPRQLHIEESLEATNIDAEPIVIKNGIDFACPYFTARREEIIGTKIIEITGMTIVFIEEGIGKLKKGDTFIIPPGIKKVKITNATVILFGKGKVCM